MFNEPVVPIPVPFNESQDLNISELSRYLDFLAKEGVSYIMTTAGTSHFNLLSLKQIETLNEVCCAQFPSKCILGLPPANKIDTLAGIRMLESKKCNILILYPDRYYDDQTVVNYFYDIADVSKNPIMIQN